MGRKWSVALAALLLILVAAVPARAQQRPNIVVVLTDDQSAESMFALPKTVQAIGSHGVTFDQSFVSLSLCCPSRATFLTGEYAHNHGVLDNQPPLGGFPAFDDSDTLPLWLQGAGYTTVHIGKYLNEYGKDDPLYIPPGWSEWHATIDPSTYSYNKNTFNDDGVLHTTGASDYNTRVITDKGVDAINRLAPSSQPFFLNLWYLAPHSAPPYDPDDPNGFVTASPELKYRDAFKSLPLPKPPSFDEADVDDKSQTIRNLPRIDAATEAGIREMWQQRLEALLSVDDGVERIINALKATGELSNTYIIFTSDNAWYHGQHRIPQGKNYIYEPGIRVPLLMRGPRIPSGQRRSQLVANVDLAPTISAMAGILPGPFVDGMSILPFATNGATAETRPAIMLESLANPNTGAPYYRGVRTQRYKLIRWSSGFRELYDLAQDPDEVSSQLTNPVYAGVLAELMRRYDDLVDCSTTVCRGASGIPGRAVLIDLSQPAQPAQALVARDSCAKLYTAAEANGSASPCPPGTWPRPGAGWAPTMQIAGADRLRLKFDQPVDRASAAIITNRTDTANESVLQKSLVATASPTEWDLVLPNLGTRAQEGLALSIVAWTGTVPRAFAARVIAP
jgi:arylsulfatase A-like enzyme